jgi:cytochrome c-type biogenesis protein CcmF
VVLKINGELMDIGSILIWISLILAVAVPILTILYYYTKDKIFRTFTIIATLLCVLTITATYLLLTHYFLTSNFDYHYVWYNSSKNTEWYLKLTGVWAGQEGSLLFWAWIIVLALGVEEFIQFRRQRKFDKLNYTDGEEDNNDDDETENDDNEVIENEPKLEHNSKQVYDWTRAIIMIVLLVFLILLVFKDPFEPIHEVEYKTADNKMASYDPLEFKPNGNGMNPMLRNMWMVIHPPILLIGYALITIPFAASLAYSVTYDKKWTKISLQWSRLAWLFLTLGIGIGAVWAYLALGWGGYWGWDAVEVGSLIPWLTLSAFLHTQLMNKRKDEYKIITTILGMSTFVLVLFATFITRSGLWRSVHAWGETEVGQILIATMIGTLIISGIIIVISYLRREETDEDYDYKKLLHWDSLTMIAAIVMFAILSVVILYVLVDTMGVVNPAAYETRLAPFIVILLIVMSICLCWRYFGKENSLYITAWTLLASLACAALLPGFFPGTDETFYKTSGFSISAHQLVGFMIPFAFLAIITSIYKMIKRINRKSLRNSVKSISPHLIHLGVALIIIGYIASQTMIVEKHERLSIGGPYFALPLGYTQYLDDGSVTEELRSAFQQYNLKLSDKAKIITKGDSSWEIRDDSAEYRLEISEGVIFVFKDTMHVGDYSFRLNKIYIEHDTGDKKANEYWDTIHAEINIYRGDDFIQKGKMFIDYYYVIDNHGHRIITGRVNAEVYVSPQPTEDLYLTFELLVNNEKEVLDYIIDLKVRTIPMMNFLWGGMILLFVGIIIRLTIDFLPPKKREARLSRKPQETLRTIRKGYSYPPDKLKHKQPPRRGIDGIKKKKDKKDKKDYDTLLEEELKRLRG